MKLVILFGPQAVGKMTVGQHLAAKTGLKLFHNHLSIDFVAPFFSYGTAAGKRLVGLIRREIFEEVSRSDLEGLIFTFVWAFDLQSDRDYINEVTALFESRGADVYWVELEAKLDIRMSRNRSDNRLLHKPTKRNIAWSEQDLVQSHHEYRLNSLPGEIERTHYLRIDNSELEAETAADAIIAHFNWRAD